MGSSQSSSAKVGVNMASRISTGISAHRFAAELQPAVAQRPDSQDGLGKLARCPVSNPRVCTLRIRQSSVCVLRVL